MLIDKNTGGIVFFDCENAIELVFVQKNLVFDVFSVILWAYTRKLSEVNNSLRSPKSVEIRAF